MQASLRITASGSVAPVAALLADKTLGPRLRRLSSAHAAAEKIQPKNGAERAWENYLAQAYERYSLAETGALRDPSRRLEEWYFPLKAKSSRITRPVLIDGYTRKLFAANKHILLLGPTGSGKTTALRFLFLACIKANASIPFYLELRSLSPKRTVIDVIREDLHAAGAGIDNQDLVTLIRRGGFVFLLDGLNEIGPVNGQKVLHQLHEFVAIARDNPVVLSARPETREATGFDFERFSLEPLALREAFDLMKRRESQDGLARHIIAKISQDNSQALRKFLTSPLRAVMLYKSYELVQGASSSPPSLLRLAKGLGE